MVSILEQMCIDLQIEISSQSKVFISQLALSFFLIMIFMIRFIDPYLQIFFDLVIMLMILSLAPLLWQICV